MAHHRFLTVIWASVLLASFDSTLRPEGTDGSALPPWFVDSDAVFIAEVKNRVLVVTEILKASKPFRVSEVAAPSLYGSVAGHNSEPTSIMTLLSIPTPTDEHQQAGMRVRQFQVTDDSVYVDGCTYHLSDVRIALAMQGLRKAR